MLTYFFLICGKKEVIDELESYCIYNHFEIVLTLQSIIRRICSLYACICCDIIVMFCMSTWTWLMLQWLNLLGNLFLEQYQVATAFLMNLIYWLSAYLTVYDLPKCFHYFVTWRLLISMVYHYLLHFWSWILHQLNQWTSLNTISVLTRRKPSSNDGHTMISTSLASLCGGVLYTKAISIVIYLNVKAWVVFFKF